MKIILNGELQNADQPIITAEDRGLLLGDGLFETLRADNANIHFFKEHMLRLQKSATFFDIPFAWSYEDLHAMMLLLLKENKLSGASIRLTLTRGTGPRGVLPPKNPLPTLFITTHLLPNLPKKSTAILIHDIRRNESSPTSQHKTLNYMDNILAARKAKLQGADIALLQNTQGMLACAHSANIFLRINGQLFTPRIEDGALPGIIRADIIEKESVICQSLPIALLKQAEEIFITNSICGILPIIPIAL